VGERRVDFLVEKKISVEIKAQAQLNNINLAQGKNYLEAYNLEVGLLINFGGNSLEWKRLFNNKFKPVISSAKSV
jgi:GxxExxY protein